MKSVVAVCFTVFVFQTVAAGPLDNRVDDRERTLDLSESYLLRGTAAALGFNYSFSIWLSEPLNSMRVDVKLPGVIDKKMLILGNEDSHGTLRDFTKIFGSELCHFVRGTSLQPITVKSHLTNQELNFEDVEIAKGEEVEKWVKHTDLLNMDLYVKRNENGVVPVRMVILLKSKNNLLVTYNVDEFTTKPNTDNVFDYDISSPCKEIQMPSGADFSNTSGFSARIFRRDVHDEAGPLNVMNDLVEAFVHN